MMIIMMMMMLVMMLVCPLFQQNVATAQDLQYHCITCEDKFDKCELDCAWALQDKNVTDVSACQDDCLSQKLDCVDGATTSKCTVCSLGCAESYDTDMRRCLASVTRLTKATYGSSISECEIMASYDMDACMNHCAPGEPAQDDYLDDVLAEQ